MRTDSSCMISSLVLPIFVLILFGAMSSRAAPGDLDTTFGVGGKVIDSSDYDVWDVDIQTDGKIVTVGTANGSFLTARYNADGSPDSTFGTNGRAVTSFGADDSGATAAAIQTDGKIVVVGWKCECFDWGNEAFVVIRYNTDGSLDASFDGDGIATTKVGLWPTAWSVAIQPDNKIIVGGFTWWGDGTFANDHFALARYNPDGSLDTTFNGDGKVITRICDHTFCNDDLQSIALQPDGKIIAVGGSFSLGSSPQFIALRYGTDGSLDGNFHLGGSSAGAQTAGGYFTSATIQLDGKILLAGTGPLPLIRLNSNGSFDTTFDFDGTVSTGLDGSYVAIQSSNRIIVAGSRNNGSNSDYKIIRFNSDGSLDTTFGGGDGESTVDFGGTNDYVRATALDRFGRAVFVGRIWAGNNALGVGIARFLLSARTAPFDYDGDGMSDFSVWRPADGTWHLVRSGAGLYTVQQWGLTGDKIVPADYDGDGLTDMAVYRPDDDGSGRGRWYVINSSNSTFNSFQFGLSIDVPLPQDYDGDGRADLCVFRPADSTWYMVKSSNNLFYQYPFGIAGDKPVPADYSGDGKAEIAVWRPADGSWHTVDLTDGSYRTFNWGIPGDVPVLGDYSGDGRADYMVYRPADNTWYRMDSDNFRMYQTRWGVANDIPVPGDYDGDGSTDLAIFRPAEGRWYVLTATYAFMTQQFGIDGDIPTESAFVY